MGGKGSGRRWIHDDEYHRKVRERQLKYDREIKRIMKNHKCSYKEAHKIRTKRLDEERDRRLRREKR